MSVKNEAFQPIKRYVELVIEANDMDKQSCKVYCARKWSTQDESSMKECTKKCADFKQLAEWSRHN